MKFKNQIVLLTHHKLELTSIILDYLLSKGVCFPNQTPEFIAALKRDGVDGFVIYANGILTYSSGAGYLASQKGAMNYLDSTYYDVATQLGEIVELFSAPQPIEVKAGQKEK